LADHRDGRQFDHRRLRAGGADVLTEQRRTDGQRARDQQAERQGGGEDAVDHEVLQCVATQALLRLSEL